MDAAAWDDRYAGSELLWTAEPNRFVVEQVGPLPVGTAVDLACGEGRNAVWLAGQGWRTTGVDFSATGLAKSRALAERARVDVRWVQHDV
ncbi:MAG: class I SAM-dependent methyltransferase, partial [Phycicoccus sp.]